MSDLRCWWCGIEPTSFIEDQRLGDPEASYIPVWPAGDHTHRAIPPTPEQLIADGHTTLRRILEAR